jgi:hypothetical protein
VIGNGRLPPHTSAGHARRPFLGKNEISRQQNPPALVTDAAKGSISLNKKLGAIASERIFDAN